jgi:protein TonB
VAGRKLYGELTMIVTVNHDGRVLDRGGAGSGNPRAGPPRRGHRPQRRALRPLQCRMRRQADQIVVVARFKFTRDDPGNQPEANPLQRA